VFSLIAKILGILSDVMVCGAFLLAAPVEAILHSMFYSCPQSGFENTFLMLMCYVFESVKGIAALELWAVWNECIKW
jgi:hypothetical protein